MPCWIASSKLFADVELISLTFATGIVILLCTAGSKDPAYVHRPWSEDPAYVHRPWSEDPAYVHRPWSEDPAHVHRPWSEDRPSPFCACYPRTSLRRCTLQ